MIFDRWENKVFRFTNIDDIIDLSNLEIGVYTIFESYKLNESHENKTFSPFLIK